MELMEAVSVVISVADADELCKGEDEPPYKGGNCRMAKHGEETDVSAEQLNKNMEGEEFLPEDPLPKIKLGKKEWWDLDKCNAGTFPYQSHHLIPKMHLPKHAVCQFLAKKAGKKKWKLKQSTNYDTDSNRN